MPTDEELLANGEMPEDPMQEMDVVMDEGFSELPAEDEQPK